MNFFSREDAINHENEGECDQCDKWLGCEKNVQTHKLKEHKIIDKKENKDSHEPNIIRADKDKFINETRIKEKDVIEMFKIVSENPDREIETTKKQDKTKEKTTKDTPMDKNKTKQKFFERSKPKKIKIFSNNTLERGNKKDKTFELNTKKHLRKNRQIMAFYTPKFAIYIQSEMKKTIEIKNPDHPNKDIIKYRKLQIWKLLDIKNVYYTMDEIIEIGIKAVKYENRNISEARIHKVWKIKKLVQGTRNRCKAKKLTKLIVSNYTK